MWDHHSESRRTEQLSGKSNSPAAVASAALIRDSWVCVVFVYRIHGYRDQHRRAIALFLAGFPCRSR